MCRGQEKGSDQLVSAVCGLQNLLSGLHLRYIPPGPGVGAGQRLALRQAFWNLLTLHLSRAQKDLKKLQECHLQQKSVGQQQKWYGGGEGIYKKSVSRWMLIFQWTLRHNEWVNWCKHYRLTSRSRQEERLLGSRLSAVMIPSNLAAVRLLSSRWRSWQGVPGRKKTELTTLMQTGCYWKFLVFLQLHKKSHQVIKIGQSSGSETTSVSYATWGKKGIWSSKYAR